MKAKNLKEFKKLIKRYESITLEEILEKEKLLHEFDGFDDLANLLTGFGSFVAITTRFMPRFIISSTQGGVLPK